MQQVILTKGISGSGKTTWSRRQLSLYPNRFKRVNRDDLRQMSGSWERTEENRVFVNQALDVLVLQALSAGYDVIVDSTNLLPRYEQRIRDLVGDRAVVLIRDFTCVPLETCIERARSLPDDGRPRIDADEVRKQHEQLIRSQEEIERYG